MGSPPAARRSWEDCVKTLKNLRRVRYTHGKAGVLAHRRQIHLHYPAEEPGTGRGRARTGAGKRGTGREEEDREKGRRQRKEEEDSEKEGDREREEKSGRERNPNHKSRPCRNQGGKPTNHHPSSPVGSRAQLSSNSPNLWGWGGTPHNLQQVILGREHTWLSAQHCLQSSAAQKRERQGTQSAGALNELQHAYGVLAALTLGS